MSLVKSGEGALRATLLCSAAASVGLLWSSAMAPALAQQAAPAGAALPQLPPSPVINAISVTGNQRIEAQTIASYLVVQPGDQATDQLLDIGLKTLFNTGLFADVTLSMQPNGTLLIEVEENPIVNQVIFEGNKRVKEDKITEEIQLSARNVFTRAKVQDDVQRIIEVYRRTGRFAATVTPKVKPLEQNRVDVIYEIDEGPKTGVAKINFIGNEAYTSNELRGELLTKESNWWRFFSSNSNYDPDRLEFERDLLRQFYARNGYADFQVISAIAELTPDRKDFFITFTVDEGEKYEIGDVRVKTTLDRLDEGTLERILPIRAGQTFDGDKVEKAVESITFATGALGYAFVDVTPRLERNPENKTIDLTFQVNEGPRVYVERINIKGNTVTLDKVIRREIRIAEGDAFNRVLVDRSKARVRSLGYFGEVEIEEKPGSGPDRTELDVSVQEQPTGSFSIGVGVSSTENFILDFSIEQRNLMGRGQFLRLRAQASSRTRNIDLRFTQPYFLGRNLAAGFSLFNSRTNFRESAFFGGATATDPNAFSSPRFIRDRTGFGLNAGFQVAEFGRGNLQYQFSRDVVDTFTPVFLAGSFDDIQSQLAPGIGPDSPELRPITSNGVDGFETDQCSLLAASFQPSCRAQGRFLTSLLGYSLAFDTRDNPIDPTRGWRFSLSQSIAGLGGDVQFLRTQGEAQYFKNLYRGFIGRLRLRAGYITDYGDYELRVQDRFFEGASSFRGFDVAGIGPRLLSGQGVDRDGEIFGQALGGNAFAIGTAEIRLPLPLPKEYGIRAAIFSDFGTVGLVDDEDKILNDNLAFFVNPEDGQLCTVSPSANCIEPVQDDLAIRISAGVSISWDSPFGPVRFDIAEILRKEEFDRVESFRFSAGTSF